MQRQQSRNGVVPLMHLKPFCTRDFFLCSQRERALGIGELCKLAKQVHLEAALFYDLPLCAWRRSNRIATTVSLQAGRHIRLPRHNDRKSAQ